MCLFINYCIFFLIVSSFVVLFFVVFSNVNPTYITLVACFFVVPRMKIVASILIVFVFSFVFDFRANFEVFKQKLDRVLRWLLLYGYSSWLICCAFYSSCLIILTFCHKFDVVVFYCCHCLFYALYCCIF